MRRNIPLLALAALFVIQVFAVVGCNPTTEEPPVTTGGTPPTGVEKPEGTSSNEPATAR